EIGLEPREQEQEHHADGADDLEQVKLIALLRENRAEETRCIMTEYGWPEDDPRRELADHRGQADAFGELRADARDDEQQRELHEEQEHRVPGNGHDPSGEPRAPRRHPIEATRTRVADQPQKGDADRARYLSGAAACRARSSFAAATALSGASSGGSP